MAEKFLDSAEFTQRFGDDDAMSNNAFIARMYLNVLDRPSDVAGAAYWINAMNAGATREQVLMSFSDSAENQAHSAYLTGLAQVQPGFWNVT